MCVRENRRAGDFFSAAGPEIFSAAGPGNFPAPQARGSFERRRRQEILAPQAREILSAAGPEISSAAGPENFLSAAGPGDFLSAAGPENFHPAGRGSVTLTGRGWWSGGPAVVCRWVVVVVLGI